VGRLGEQAMHRIAEGQLETEGDPAGAAADATRQIDEQRVFGIDQDAGLLELPREALGGDRVTENSCGEFSSSTK